MTDYEELEPEDVCEEHLILPQKWSMYYLGAVLCAFLENCARSWVQLFDDFRSGFQAHALWKQKLQHEDQQVMQFREELKTL